LLGTNMFTYCNNKPVLFIDPSGCKISTAGASKTNLIYYSLALLYLSRTEEGADIINYAMQSPETLTIRFSEFAEIGYYPESKSIWWDPKSALVLENRDVISPAVILAHELYHFKQHMEGGSFETEDDRRRLDTKLVENFEIKLCIALGEPPRYDYDDGISFLKVSSPLDFGHLSQSGAFIPRYSAADKAALITQIATNHLIASLNFKFL